MDFIEVLLDIVLNPVFISAIVAVVVSQVLKLFYYYFKEKKVNLRYLASSGGFPSSHAATVTALTISIGLLEGFNSTFFIMAVTFSLIVMYDAAGVRQAAGEQARILNKIVDEVVPDKHINNYESLKELIGHTPLEVLAGAVIGFLTALAIHFYL